MAHGITKKNLLNYLQEKPRRRFKLWNRCDCIGGKFLRSMGHQNAEYGAVNYTLKSDLNRFERIEGDAPDWFSDIVNIILNDDKYCSFQSIIEARTVLKFWRRLGGVPT